MKLPEWADQGVFNTFEKISSSSSIKKNPAPTPRTGTRAKIFQQLLELLADQLMQQKPNTTERAQAQRCSGKRIAAPVIDRLPEALCREATDKVWSAEISPCSKKKP